MLFAINGIDRIDRKIIKKFKEPQGGSGGQTTKVQIYTDGSARGNPDGPGGYGAVLHFTDQKGCFMSGSFPPDM